MTVNFRVKGKRISFLIFYHSPENDLKWVSSEHRAESPAPSASPTPVTPASHVSAAQNRVQGETLQAAVGSLHSRSPWRSGLVWGRQ